MKATVVGESSRFATLFTPALLQVIKASVLEKNSIFLTLFTPVLHRQGEEFSTQPTTHVKLETCGH